MSTQNIWDRLFERSIFGILPHPRMIRLLQTMPNLSWFFIFFSFGSVYSSPSFLVDNNWLRLVISAREGSKETTRKRFYLMNTYDRIGDIRQECGDGGVRMYKMREYVRRYSSSSLGFEFFVNDYCTKKIRRAF